MLYTPIKQVIYKTQVIGPCMLFKEPLLTTARQLRKRWDQRILLLGNGVALFNQPRGSNAAVNHTVVVGRLACIQQRKLPPLKVNKLLSFGVIAQSMPGVIHLPPLIVAPSYVPQT